MDRRSFLRLLGLTSAAAVLAPSVVVKQAEAATVERPRELQCENGACWEIEDDDLDNIPFGGPLGEPMTHAQLADAFSRRTPVPDLWSEPLKSSVDYDLEIRRLFDKVTVVNNTFDLGADGIWYPRLSPASLSFQRWNGSEWVKV